ncbi:MAG: outer membrane lipoprotein LolB [Gammaproteobacteria bacterium]|nr:MAG: outer membrane lipoprotein LolB [Gammaproteobacteria bacterium]
MIQLTVWHRFAPIILLLTCVSACTSLRPVQPSEWVNRQAALLVVDDWEFRGRMAFKSNDEGGQAKLRWQQAGDTSFIHLAGPFGAGAYDLIWEPGRVSVADSGGKQSVEYHGPDAAEQFLHDQLGWSFPAGSTRYWVMGLLDPAAPGDERFDDAGVLLGIKQHGWNINYERFSDFDGFALPTRVSMEKGSTHLRIAISKWTMLAVEG